MPKHIEPAKLAVTKRENKIKFIITDIFALGLGRSKKEGIWEGVVGEGEGIGELGRVFRWVWGDLEVLYLYGNICNRGWMLVKISSGGI